MKKTVYFLLICMVGIIYSCKEDDVLNSSHQAADAHNQKAGVREFDPRTDSEVLKILSKSFSEGKLLINNSYSKGETDSLYIDSATVVEAIQPDGVKRYTFRLLSNSAGNDFYNLIVEDAGNDSYVIQYIPDEEWLNSGGYEMFDFTGQMITMTRNGEILSEVNFNAGVADPCDPDLGDGDPGSGGGGSGGGSSGGGGGTGDTGGGSGGNSGGGEWPGGPVGDPPGDSGGGSGGGGSGGDDDIPFYPGAGDCPRTYLPGWGIFSADCDTISEYLMNTSYNKASDPCGVIDGTIGVIQPLGLLNHLSLTQSQRNWLINNQNIAIQITVYLGIAPSQEKKDFAMWAIDYLIVNPDYEFNNLLWINNLGFSSIEKNHIFNNSSLVNFMNELMLQNDIDLDSKERIAGLYVAFEVAHANNTLSSLSQNPLYDYFWDKIEEYISSAAYNGAAKVFRMMHRLYWVISETTSPNKITAWNLFVIDPIRSAVANSNYVNMTPNTMSWKDVLLIWLFELGNYPNIYAGHPTIQLGSLANIINGTTNIDGIKNHNNGVNSVGFARNDVKAAITNSNIHSGTRNYFWHFNTQALSNFISSPNYMEFTLGSYNTSINWYSLTSNNNYNFMFNIKNVTGWNSATRGVNGTYIIPDKPRGQGIHLGGTIAETFIWTELFTP